MRGLDTDFCGQWLVSKFRMSSCGCALDAVLLVLNSTKCVLQFMIFEIKGEGRH